jgi:hypothetical protein
MAAASRAIAKSARRFSFPWSLRGHVAMLR